MRRLLCLSIVGLAFFGLLDSPALAATVKGTVTPAAWAQEVEVCAIGTQPYEWCAVPGPDGRYTYPGVEGTVTFEFIPTYRSRLLTQYYDHKSNLEEARYIEVGKEEVEEGINADLTAGGSVTGTVTAAVGGAPLAEVEVCAVSVPSPAVPTMKSCEETDAAGDYELHSLPGAHYTVGFWGHGASAGYQPSYYENQSSVLQATPILVTAGEATTGIDAALSEGGQIGGVVTAAAGGGPLEGITVCLFEAARQSAERCTESSGGGTYTFRGLPDGTYQVGFSLEAGEIGGIEGSVGQDGFESQYYNAVASRSQAATISVLAPSFVDDVSAALLVSPVPAAATFAPAASPPISAAPPIAVAPLPKKTICTKPKRKEKVQGRVRCVNPAAGHRNHHHRHTHHVHKKRRLDDPT